MPNTIIASPVNAPTTLPDAAACVAREQRRRKMEQDIDMLWGPITPTVTAHDPTAWRGTVTAFFEDAVRRADAGREAQP